MSIEQPAAGQDQIDQAEQREQLRDVLCQTPVARLPAQKTALHLQNPLVPTSSIVSSLRKMKNEK